MKDILFFAVLCGLLISELNSFYCISKELRDHEIRIQLMEVNNVHKG